MKIDCKHGQLARSCYICELEEELAKARADLARAKLEAEHMRPVVEAAVRWNKSAERFDLSAESDLRWRVRAYSAVTE